jgi:predicted nucleic acid-binding protein
VIVVDANWIVALRDPGDAHHHRAAEISREIADEETLLHPVTLAECLVAPAKLGVLEQASAALRAAFAVADTDTEAPVRWAAKRAETGLRLPDVIVLDTALHYGARAIATFDEQLAARATDHRLTVLGRRLA